jgi:Flp pilus assembly pilin Flp
MMRNRPRTGFVDYFRSAKRRAEAAQTLVEYTMLIAFMSIALVGALGAYRGGLGGKIQEIIDTLVALF